MVWNWVHHSHLWHLVDYPNRDSKWLLRVAECVGLTVADDCCIQCFGHILRSQQRHIIYHWSYSPMTSSKIFHINLMKRSFFQQPSHRMLGFIPTHHRSLQELLCSLQPGPLGRRPYDISTTSWTNIRSFRASFRYAMKLGLWVKDGDVNFFFFQWKYLMGDLPVLSSINDHEPS